MSPISVKLLTTIFQKNLFKVFQAGSIAEGEQSILDNSPDVIILRSNASRWLRLNSCAETLNQTIETKAYSHYSFNR